MIEGQLLNSRSYNAALETDNFTCDEHRVLRQLERKVAQTTYCKVYAKNGHGRLLERKITANTPEGRDVYSLASTIKVLVQRCITLLINCR